MQASDVSKVYASRAGLVRALDHLSLQQRRGEFLSIVGPSGCGKSTFLMIAAGLASASAGTISVEGREIKGPRSDVGIVFQSPVLLEWRTALGNVMLQAEARKLEKSASVQRARELLASVGLSGFESKYPHELSGGMRQRVSICRSLIHDPPHLLMDEPFGALDALTRDQLVLDMQKICSDRQMSVLFITHSVDEAVFLSDRVVVMSPRPGRIDRIIEIDLPRPRTLALRKSTAFAAYCSEILDIFLARGVLHER